MPLPLSAKTQHTGLSGAVIYTTRYPFSASVFQAHLMGIRKIVVLGSRVGALLQRWIPTCCTSSTRAVHCYWTNVWRRRPTIYKEYHMTETTTNALPRLGPTKRMNMIQQMQQLPTMKTQLLFDLESTGLLRRGSRIHCIVMRDAIDVDEPCIWPQAWACSPPRCQATRTSWCSYWTQHYWLWHSAY